MSARAWCLGALAAVGLAACASRPLFDKARPMIERANPNVPIPAGGYRTIAYVSGGGGMTDFQISSTVRQQLEDSGFTMLRRAGRWDDERSAVRAICAPDAVPVVDGVLFIWYNRLELRDCATEGVAFEVKSSPDKGITHMTNRLVVYLRRPPTAAAGQAAPPQ